MPTPEVIALLRDAVKALYEDNFGPDGADYSYNEVMTRINHYLAEVDAMPDKKLPHIKAGGSIDLKETR